MSCQTLSQNLHNAEEVVRDWLFYSESKKSFYCIPCRSLSKSKKSKLTQVDGWSPENYLYKKFAEKVNSHENTPEHRNNYIQWKKM